MISQHEISTFRVVQTSSGWLTARQIAPRAAVAERTARWHAARLVALGVFEQDEVFGGYRYRVQPHATADAEQLIAALNTAAAVLGAAP